MNLLRRRKDSDSELVGDGQRFKSRKPANTAFKQQRLKSWQPILTPKSVLPLLLVIAVIFAPLGIVMLITSYNVQQIVIDYSQCSSLANTKSYTSLNKKFYSQHFKTSSNTAPSWKLSNKKVMVDNGNGSYESKVCHIQFTVPSNIDAPIYMYYKLTNFYQNHREYVDSYDLSQLKGDVVSVDDLNSKCSPIKKNSENKPYYPCGLIANSWFNDSFSSPVLLNPQGSSTEQTYSMSTTGISWSSDIKRFKKTKYSSSSVVPPPNWGKKYPNGYTDDNMFDITKEEGFQNWMRTAGLPSFMKLVSKNTDDELQNGNYRVDIELNYPTSIYGGKKYLVLTTNSIIGGRNISLGVAYIVVSGICVLFGIIFLVKQVVSPRKIGDNKYLDFNKDNQAGGGRGFRDIL